MRDNDITVRLTFIIDDKDDGVFKELLMIQRIIKLNIVYMIDCVFICAGSRLVRLDR